MKLLQAKWFGMAVMFIAAISLLGLGATFPVYNSYAGKAQLVQRIQVDKAAEAVFDDEGTAIGSPQQLIIEDQAAFLPGTTKDGAKKVSENYLQEKKIYPLQLQTVGFVVGNVRMGLGAALLVAGLLLFVRQLGAKKQKSEPQ